MTKTKTKSAYEQLGVSATKEDVHKAIAHTDAGLFPGAFCRIGKDVLGGRPAWCCASHADDAGTKVLVAYLLYKETGDATVFRGISQDALVMNLDDLLCIGATSKFLLSNTINRNSFVIPGEVIREVVAGYDHCINLLADHGIRMVATGGETADMNDVVRTILIGATLTTRMRRKEVVDNSRIRAGDVIVGLSSTGQASYEQRPNSGIGDNGLTLARHSMLHHDYAEKFPETIDPRVDSSLAYRGPFHLEDAPEGLGMTVGEALASPTRTYAPVVRQVLAKLGRKVHGIVHNTGGGQTKCIRFGENILFEKDHLFEPPPLFRLIAEHGGVGWREMYQTFNMGHRMELFLPEKWAGIVVDVAAEYQIDARIVGRCSPAEHNRVLLKTAFGDIAYP